MNLKDGGALPIDFDASDLCEELISFSRHVRQSPNAQACKIVAGICRHLDSVAKKAAQFIAVSIDNSPHYLEPEYHNVSHYLDVGVTALAFALEEKKHSSDFLAQKGMALSREDISDCFIAGLIHDLGHPGGGNSKDVPFELELNSWNLAEPLLIKAGYKGKRLARLKTMLLSTDPAHGVPVIEKAMGAHSTLQETTGFLPHAHLSGLRDIKTAVMSYMLAKADISFSLMLETYLDRVSDLHNEHAAKQTGMKFLDENGVPIKSGAVFFFEKIAGVTPENKFMLRSVENIIGQSAQMTLRAVLNGHIVPEQPKRKFRLVAARHFRT